MLLIQKLYDYLSITSHVSVSLNAYLLFVLSIVLVLYESVIFNIITILNI
jgi:hypothetical protein